MTDRISALTVVLDTPLRSDDAEPLIAAIKLLRGVLSVTPHVDDGLADYVALVRTRTELGEALMRILYPEVHKEPAS